MKQSIFFSFALLFIVSCKKQDIGSGDQVRFGQLRQALSASMQPADYTRLNFDKASVVKAAPGEYQYWYIPMRGSADVREFLAVRYSDSLAKLDGRLVRYDCGQAAARQVVLHSTIQIRDLDGLLMVNSQVVAGKIAAFHKGRDAKISEDTESEEEDMGEVDRELPEVIVVSSYSDGGISINTWFLLTSLFESDGGGYPDDFYPMYLNIDGTGNEQENDLELEYVDEAPKVKVSKMKACFGNVTSTGARYSIKLCTDVPSNNSPGASTTAKGFGSGHTFLTLTKTNGYLSVSQSFGFYPGASGEYGNPFEQVSGAVKDNGLREYNAMIEEVVSESQFEHAINLAIDLSSHDYNLMSFNCTNYGLDVFNSVRETPITVEPYPIILPGISSSYTTTAPSNILYIDKTPQMLFNKLESMKNGGSSDNVNIVIDLSHNSKSPVSKGECN